LRAPGESDAKSERIVHVLLCIPASRTPPAALFDLGSTVRLDSERDSRGKIDIKPLEIARQTM
jgi:hypothetical protein